MEGSVYCPRCDKSIPKEELQERADHLKTLFGKESLSSGKCPVCGTRLIDVGKVGQPAKDG